MNLQETLVKMGLLAGRPDGRYGRYTAAAVREFQVRVGLPPTGAMDRMTWRAFGQRTGRVASQAPQRLSGKVHLLVDTARNRLTVYHNYRPVREYVVATGKFSSPTPIGDWKVISKDSWGEGFGTRWMGLSVPWGIFGIHGTNKPWEIGGDVSAGCVRMFNEDIEELFEWVSVGTPVKIIGHPLGPMAQMMTLENDYRGPNVMLVQRRLKAAGFYKGTVDGVYGLETMDAVKDFQKAKKLPATGSFDEKCYKALKLIRFE